MPGAGDQDLDRAELGPAPGERGVDRGPVGHVDLDGDHLAALALQLRGGRLGALAVAVEDGHLVAVGHELPGDAEPDARGAAGDDCDPAHEAPPSGVNSMCSRVRPRRIQVGS